MSTPPVGGASRDIDSPRDIVVVGASLAGLRAAEMLRTEGYIGRIHLVGDEPHEPYNRPPLSKKILADPTETADLPFRYHASLDATWHLGDAAVGLDPVGKQVTLASGLALPYDRLLITTGVRARWPDLLQPGSRTTAVRTIDDARRLGHALASGRSVAVIGGGFIGCEVAAAARTSGLRVTLIDMASAPLVNLIGSTAAQFIRDRHEAEGVDMRFGVGVAGVIGTPDEPRALTLSDGSEVECDVVVIGIGTMPNVEWLQNTDAVVNNGLVCNAQLAVQGLTDVWAAGDIARWPHPRLRGASTRVEHWTHAAMSGMTAARNLLTPERAVDYDLLPEFWSDQYDMNIRGIGLMGPQFEFERLEVSGNASFLGLYRSEGRPVGAVAVNATRDLNKLRRSINAAS